MKKYFLILFIVLVELSSCSKNSSTSNQVKDYDGNVYDTVVIGTQTWMVENLKTTHYRDGSAISNIPDSIQWTNIYKNNLSTPAYCDYNNDPANGSAYGHLYNWYAVNNIAGLSPIGWHVPTDSEWNVLTTYLGGSSIAGGLMKSTVITLWISPNTDATDSSGFKGLPGGYRNYYFGTYYNIGQLGDWWSSTESSTSNAWNPSLYYRDGVISMNTFLKGNGLSVRCIKN